MASACAAYSKRRGLWRRRGWRYERRICLGQPPARCNGHARGAVVGDVLARLLEKTGSDVAREYYINDAGAQVDVLAQSALLRMREAKGETIGDIPDGLYLGDYLVPVGEKLAAMELPEDEAASLAMAKSVALPMMMDMIREDLAALGVVHDFFRSEQALHDDSSVDKAFDELTAKELIYQGVLSHQKAKNRRPIGSQARKPCLNQPNLVTIATAH